VGNTERAAKIQSRLDALGISDREFAERTGVDRKALRRAANGEAVRGSTYVAIETWLTRLERETGDVEVEELPEGFEYIGDPRQRFISFEVPDARIVVKGPIEDADLLREQAERIAERARQQREKLKEIATDEP
jgi:transcriptional regulator with XRE-family HTH domain